jgi:hypothetical protein
MTPTEMVRTINQQIEAARAALEDGPVGYVLHNYDHTYFLCQRGDAAVHLGGPTDDDVAVLSTRARAVVMQRYWNSLLNKDEQNKLVLISLRRDALNAYIDLLQKTVDTLVVMGATE